MRALTLALSLVAAICVASYATDLAVGEISNGATEAQRANTINPYELLSLTREELAQRFPRLSEVELDLLVFKIADINSIRSLN